MVSKQIILEANSYTANAKTNILYTKEAAQFGISGLKLFETPLVGFGNAKDPLFVHMKQKSIVGPQFMPPEEWLANAKTVISFFFPFTEAVRKSNYTDDSKPSVEWLFGQMEGQRFLNGFTRHISTMLESQEYFAVVPSADMRFQCVTVPDVSLGKAWEGCSFTSNWSERHVAYICGLGTFGLSGGLITEKGIAGRLCSIITNADFPLTERYYSGIYDYCNMCGACIGRCPAGAISLPEGKSHHKCSPFALAVREPYSPRDGCGKCHVYVPCESGIPKR